MQSTGLVLAIVVLICGRSYGSLSSSLEETVGATITPMDILFDFVLAQMKDEISDEGDDDYQIPDFIYKISLPLWTHVTVEGRGGTFKNASSLTRLGPAFAGSADTNINMTLSADAGLEVFDITFDYFKAKFLFFEIGGGPCEFKTASNKITFSMTILTPTDLPCESYLNWARIEDFTGQTLSLSPGILNSVTEWFVNTAMDWSFVKDITIKQINPTFFLVAQQAVDLVNYCGIQ